MKDSPTRSDLLLDLLADEVAKRLEARARPAGPPPPPVTPPVPAQAAPAAASGPAPKAASPSPAEPALAPVPQPQSPPVEAPFTAGPSHAAALMARLVVGVLLVVVLINIPYNAQGTALARSIPSSAALVIANGLLVKEGASPDVWVYRDEAFHWVTSLDAFEHYGYRWEDVHTVEPGFLGQFARGAPIHVLLKCATSPHIYRLEGGKKRWIVDIPTFTAEGHEWRDVKMVACSYLRGLPDGDSIPPGRGSPPPPLP